MPSPYRSVLGSELDRLPPWLRDFHSIQTGWSGKAVFRVTRGKGLLRNLVAWLGGLPPAGEKVPVELSCRAEQRGDRWVEVWDRNFQGFRMRSSQWAQYGMLVESFGWISLGYKLHVEPPSLRLEVIKAWVAGIPVPLFLAPTGEGLEKGNPDGSISVRAAAIAPILGQIVCYEGLLRKDDL